MRVIIAGGRDITPAQRTITDAARRLEMKHGDGITHIVTGCATGVDRAGEKWARQHMCHVVRFPADWKQHGRAAGPLRNREMAQNADALILIWDGKSRGSASMKREAEARGLHIEEVVV